MATSLPLLINKRTDTTP